MLAAAWQVMLRAIQGQAVQERVVLRMGGLTEPRGQWCLNATTTCLMRASWIC